MTNITQSRPSGQEEGRTLTIIPCWAECRSRVLGKESAVTNIRP